MEILEIFHKTFKLTHIKFNLIPLILIILRRFVFMDFYYLDEFYIHGEYQKVLALEKNQNLYSNSEEMIDLDKSIVFSYISRSLIRLGRIEEADVQIKNYKTSILNANSSFKDFIDETTLINLQITKGKSQDTIAKFRQFDQQEILIKKLQENNPKEAGFWLCYYFYLVGIAFYYELNYDESLCNFQKSLDLNVSNKYIKGKSFYYLAFVNLEQGDIFNFEKFLDQSTEIFLELQAKQGLGWNLIWKANFEIQKGNYNESKKFLERASEIFNDIGGKQEQYFIKSLFGLIHFHKGQFEEAKELLNESFTQSIKLGNPMLSSYIILPFTLVNIELGNREIIKTNLKLFEDLQKDSRIFFHLNLSKAVFFKSSTKLVDKAKAEELFLELLKKTNTESTNFWSTSDKSTRFFLVINLAEIYYLEFLISNDFDSLREIQDLLNEVLNTKLKSNEIIEISLLKSKLFVVEGKIGESLDELESAKKLAIKNDYVRLIEVVNDEIVKIQNQIDKWGSDSTILDRIKAVNMKAYIKDALKLTSEKIFQ